MLYADKNLKHTNTCIQTKKTKGRKPENSSSVPILSVTTNIRSDLKSALHFFFTFTTIHFKDWEIRLKGVKVIIL